MCVCTVHRRHNVPAIAPAKPRFAPGTTAQSEMLMASTSAVDARRSQTGDRRWGTSRSPTPLGRMPAYFSSAGGDGPWRGVVVLRDGFGIDQAVREQADWLAGAGYLAVSVDQCFWGRPSVCLLRMFRDLRAGRGQTFEQVDTARMWLACRHGCSGRFGVIGFCATGGFALLVAAGHGYIRETPARRSGRCRMYSTRISGRVGEDARRESVPPQCSHS